MISKPFDKNFNTAVRGNNASALDSRKAKMLENTNLVFTREDVEIKGRITAYPAPHETFQDYTFRCKADGNGLPIKVQTYEAQMADLTIFRKVKSISLEKFGKILSIDENNVLLIDEKNLFRALSSLYETSYSTFFSLTGFLKILLQSSFLYVRCLCVCPAGKTDIPLTYKQAVEKYEEYRSVKSSNKKAILSEFLTVPRLGSLYETNLCFNRSYPVHDIMNNSDSVIFLSGTWNSFLIQTVLDSEPFCQVIKNEKLRTDLTKLCFMINRNREMKAISSEVEFLNEQNLIQETTLSDRFSEGKLKLEIEMAEAKAKYRN